ncbi:probable RNA-binding protein 18 isoform X2 [Frankliniella occidentalis]|uniref:Probable RNA-binding protein 18 n=1 Tax=Frankliniella occidentalis TaxID=133901 RepID=A0A6J1T5G5_FRAOC|nr:probable RNA-binding protein 18 isoform X2 [Frankliniella occidentalis]
MDMAAGSENHLSTVIPIPRDEPNLNNEIQDKRLWIGNLDPRLSEYNLLKLLQKYGTIDKFDLLFHRSGPLSGFPRGYAFCTYKNTEDAVLAMQNMDGQLVGSKQITVRWAHSMSKDEMESKPKAELSIPVLAGAKSSKAEKKPVSKKTAIQAIEAKLRLMEQSNTSDEFEINNSPAALRSKSYILSQAQNGHDARDSRPSHSRFGRKYDRKPYHRGHHHR